MPARPGAGRPKGALNKVTRDIKALAEVHTPDALKTLAGIAKTGLSEAARVSAAVALLDRAYGKPSQAMSVDASVMGSVTITYVTTSAPPGTEPAGSDEDYET